jgi:hypothetical protein
MMSVILSTIARVLGVAVDAFQAGRLYQVPTGYLIPLLPTPKVSFDPPWPSLSLYSHFVSIHPSSGGLYSKGG